MAEKIKRTYLRAGNKIRVDNGSLIVTDHLEPATYVASWSKDEGPFLVQVEDMRAGSGKIYGGRHAKVEKAFRAFKHLKEQNKSTGIMLSGPKGLGKSVVLRQIGERAMAEGLPVILVENNFPGVANFLANLGEVVVMFDEFEKKFVIDEDDNGNQDQFLSLFDGTGNTPQMYVITTNSTRPHRLSEYLLDRPGRIRYHIQLQHPTPAEVREYLSDQVPEADAEVIDQIANAQLMAPLVYDQLHAIATEMKIQGEETSMVEIFQDLNITRPTTRSVEVTVKFAGGLKLNGSLRNVINTKTGLLVKQFLENQKDVRAKSADFGDDDGDIFVEVLIPYKALSPAEDGSVSVDTSMVKNQSAGRTPNDRQDEDYKDQLDYLAARKETSIDPTEQPENLGALLGEPIEVIVEDVATSSKPSFVSNRKTADNHF